MLITSEALSQATPKWAGTAASGLTRRPAWAGQWVRPCQAAQGRERRPEVCSGVWWAASSRGRRPRTRPAVTLGQRAPWKGWPANTPGGDIMTTTHLSELHSSRSGLSVTSSGMEQETVKFKLVEDLSLVTIPITTCLLVLLGRIYIFSSWFLWSDVGLLGYILFGAALFSVWEVCEANSDIKINYIFTYSQGWSILDGAYFCFTSLMTIGFGDFVPGNSYIYNKTGSISEVSIT